jgi:hypothetical protein
MATSSFNLDLTDCIEEAFERATGGVRTLQTGYDYRTARRSLNLLTMEWANRGLNLWTLEQGTIPLQKGVASYQLPADTIDVVEFSLRTNGLDQSISRCSVTTYAGISNKMQAGRPQQVYVQRAFPNPSITLWPVPDSDEFTFVGWRMRRIQDAGSTGSQTMDIPFRFIPAMIAGLAFYISQKVKEGEHRAEALKLEYELQFELAALEDRDKSTVRIVPRIA